MMQHVTYYMIILMVILAGCRDPKVVQKMDGNLKAELKQLHETGHLDERIPILFRINEKFTDMHREVLEQKGVKISAHIGDLYTATVPANKVYDIAKFRFVDYVQGQKNFKTQRADSTQFIP
ncbi:hypothetical protein JW960_04080 [candidate division KSB1 bacterium]|nr:hypothetical protein [candidate division KSB1 bacterium]